MRWAEPEGGIGAPGARCRRRRQDTVIGRDEQVDVGRYRPVAPVHVRAVKAFEVAGADSDGLNSDFYIMRTKLFGQLDLSQSELTFTLQDKCFLHKPESHAKTQRRQAGF